MSERIESNICSISELISKREESSHSSERGTINSITKRESINTIEQKADGLHRSEKNKPRKEIS